MNTLTVVIEKAENNFSAYLKEVDGITASGQTIDHIKTSLLSAIEAYVETCKEIGCELPPELSEEYELKYEMDIQSLLNIYEGVFTKSGLEKLTGINQKQLWHYAQGISRPRAEQRQKIESALHRLGSELISLSL